MTSRIHLSKAAVRRVLFAFLFCLCASFIQPGTAGAGTLDKEILSLLEKSMRQHEETWDLSEYSSGKNREAESSCSEQGMHVTVHDLNLAWGEWFPVPPRMKNNTRWKATLTIRDINDLASSGIVLRNETTGILFQTDRFGNAELRLIVSNVDTTAIQTFKHTAPLKFPFDLHLLYNSVTGETKGMINDDTLFTVTLPYYGIPAIACITAVEIETTSPVSYRQAAATYSQLRLEGN